MKAKKVLTIPVSINSLIGIACYGLVYSCEIVSTWLAEICY